MAETIALVASFIVIFLTLSGMSYRNAARNRADAEEIARLKHALEASTPSETCLRDIAQVWQHPENDSERTVLVKFRTIAGMQDFHRWIRRKSIDAGLRARAEALQNGRGKSAPVLNVACK